jgi:PAS domain S-box-containing protein
MLLIQEARVRTTRNAYTVGFLALLLAVALRWALNPLMGDSLPLVTLFGAVAAGVWLGGYRLAIPIALLGYIACHFLFIPPRYAFDFADTANVIGLVAYLFTCALIVIFGEAARIAESRAHQRMLERNKANRLIAAIVESSDDAIISKSLEGIIQSWNAAAERLFGYTAEEAVGQHISLVIPPDRIAEEDQIIASLKAGKRIDHFETERLRNDGRRIVVSLTISPIKDALGNVIGASKIVRDVTDRIRAEGDLKRLAADLSAADQRKNEFLATLAHELRNPLAPMSNMLEVVKRAGNDTEILKRAHETLERQLNQMIRLVDDLLDLNRITHDRLELRRSEVELSSVIQQAVEVARPLIDAANHELIVELPKEPIYLNADRARLAQVFGNLLNNSCKYTRPNGTITLSAKLVDDEVLVTVKDNGAGIPPDKIGSIFDMFMQVDRSSERSQGGLGIGLTLVKRLVEMHGGSIEARSEGEGQGSEFIVRLPVIMKAATPLPASEVEPKSQSERRVLIVDDNLDSADSLAMLLNITGNKTFLAHDGVEALEAVEKYRPEVILLDIGLPKLDGHEVCRRVREQPWGKDIIIIALTGWGQEDDRRKSEEAGFNGHLVKPVDYDRLLELLGQLTNRA